MKRTVNYDEALVVYLDILGFRELVETETAGHISRTIRLVRDAIRPNRDRARLYEMAYQSFSDLAVISIPLLTSANLNFRPGVLVSQILGLADAQVKLLNEGIVLRGGMTFGSIVRSYGQLFGPALIRAYELERTKAKYPRIVVDELVLRELERNPALTSRADQRERDQIMSLLRKDADGLWFIDYLRALYGRVDARTFRQFARRHRDLIRVNGRQFAHNKGVSEKYEWLAKYHDLTVKHLKMRKLESILI